MLAIGSTLQMKGDHGGEVGSARALEGWGSVGRIRVFCGSILIKKEVLTTPTNSQVKPFHWKQWLLADRGPAGIRT